ncbi:hypothetical protein BURK2_02960 [Burkholderiales bacterium]|nr:hypothetical protein BURK2_02960 [Burkholderiales bacterium]
MRIHEPHPLTARTLTNSFVAATWRRHNPQSLAPCRSAGRRKATSPNEMLAASAAPTTHLATPRVSRVSVGAPAGAKQGLQTQCSRLPPLLPFTSPLLPPRWGKVGMGVKAGSPPLEAPTSPSTRIPKPTRKRARPRPIWQVAARFRRCAREDAAKVSSPAPKGRKRLVTAPHTRRQSRKPSWRRRAQHRNCRTAGLNASARNGAAKKPIPKNKKPGFLAEDRAMATEATSELQNVRSLVCFTRKLSARRHLPPRGGRARKSAQWPLRQRLHRRKRMAKRKSQTTLLGQKTIAKPAAKTRRGTRSGRAEERYSAIRSCTSRRQPWRPKTVQGDYFWNHSRGEFLPPGARRSA